MIGRPFRLSDARLERLLEHDPERFEKLLSNDPSIADRFEGRRILSASAVEVLRDAFAPPADLATRLNARLTSAFDSPSARATAFDLLGLGLATVRELTRDDPA